MSAPTVTHLDTKWTSIAFDEDRVLVGITAKDNTERVLILDVKDGKLTLTENKGLKLMDPEEALLAALTEDLNDLLGAN